MRMMGRDCCSVRFCGRIASGWSLSALVWCLPSLLMLQVVEELWCKAELVLSVVVVFSW